MQWQKKTAPVRDALRIKAGSAAEQATQVTVDQRAIDDGRRPLSPRRRDSAALRAKAVELYGIPAAGYPAILAIESEFKFSELPSDADFSHLHVEELLEQAGGLLARCAAARTERERLHLEKWKLAMEMDRFFDAGVDVIERIHFDAGVNNGRLHVPCAARVDDHAVR
jgi:hypothetical protein